ncbi:hypothetical protein WMY93_022696 [Mugilogobius chulae]|uniref:RING-type domain-containing protein n=1 Tax=Mugilogobius chulae TaxID=88201 RepID=A0AAW0NDG1_9GOBI
MHLSGLFEGKGPCKHICWILMKKFRLPKEHEYSFQCGLSERQISEVLHGSHQHQTPQTSPPAAVVATAEGFTPQEPGEVLRRDILPQDVCPICQEELLERKQPVAYCRFSCGNNVHISCMRVWAQHRERSDSDSVMVKCPLCREDFCSIQSLWEQVKNAARLYTSAERERQDKHLGASCNSCRLCPILGSASGKVIVKHYFKKIFSDLTYCFNLCRCTICTFAYFCESCLEKGTHPQHPLAVRSEGLQCRLCLQSFKLGQRLRALPCCHKFHAECVDGILRMTNACPLDGFVIYNPKTQRDCERKINSKLASPGTVNQTTGNDLQDCLCLEWLYRRRNIS